MISYTALDTVVRFGDGYYKTGPRLLENWNVHDVRLISPKVHYVRLANSES